MCHTVASWYRAALIMPTKSALHGLNVAALLSQWCCCVTVAMALWLCSIVYGVSTCARILHVWGCG
jgi:hypothetical protein